MKNTVDLIERCIRERNCGTGYQVDPVTQTCVGKNEILHRMIRKCFCTSPVENKCGCQWRIHQYLFNPDHSLQKSVGK